MRSRTIASLAAALCASSLLVPVQAQAAQPTIAITKQVVKANGFFVDWKPVPKAKVYHVQLSSQRDMSPRTHQNAKASEATVRKLKAGQRYWVRIVAMRGKRVLESSKALKVTIPKLAPPTPTQPTSPPSSSPTAALSSAVHSGVVQLGNGTYTFSDFSQMGSTAGYEIPASVSSISGNNQAKTVLEMTPNSSTHAAAVPTASGTTNQLSLLVSHGTALSNLTLQGTAQGHLYNGLRVHRANNTHVTNVKVVAMPGNKNYPPGETFGINDYRTVGSVYSDLEIDGAGVGAAGFGGNNSQDISITKAYFHNNPYSAGITFWQSSNITLTDVRSFDNHGGFNFERDSGNVRIVRPAWGNLGNKHAFSFNSDQASAKVSIIDPVLPAGETKVKILVAASYLGVPNKQQKSDIHVYQNGKDVTSTLALFVG